MRLFWVVCCLLIATRVGAVHSLPDEAHVAVRSPSFAERKIEKFRLLNGLEVYCISDPHAEKSAASLTVRVGSWSDPDEFPGLAHFLEHMLFLGTKQFPKEAGYRQFIQENNGQANAYTAPDHTLYQFAIDNDLFSAALNRFSDFFKEPLFNPSGVARELLAIDQEYAKNVENDAVRQYYVSKVFAHQKHPHRRFTIGNLKTLQPVKRETFLKWYQDHYSANLMHLVVYTSLPLEEIKPILINEFQPVRNTYRQPFTTTHPLYAPIEQPQWVFIKPIKRIKRLTVQWELPFSYDDKRARDALEFYSFLLGHEGSTSLLSHYKEKKWAEGIRCGPSNPGSEHLLFSVQIDLTSEGLNNLEEVVEALFATIAFTQETLPPVYLQDEFEKMKWYHYLYPEKVDAYHFVSDYGGLLMHEDLRTFPEKSLLPKTFDLTFLQKITEKLTPDKSLFFVLAPNEELSLEFDQEEPWVGVSFTTVPIEEDVLNQWHTATPLEEYDYPSANPFMISSFPTLPSAPQKVSYPSPQLLVENEKGKLYFAKDDRFLLPTIHFSFEVQSPFFEKGKAFREVQTDVFVRSFVERLNPIAYLAKLAGIAIRSETVDRGIRFQISGPKEKIPLFLDIFFDSLWTFEPSEEEVFSGMESFSCLYENGLRETPLRQGLDFLHSILRKPSCTKKEKCEALEKLTLKNFHPFPEKAFQKTHLTGVLYGNLKEEEAREIWRNAENHFPSLPYREDERKKAEILVLPETNGPFFFELKTENKGNATILAIESLPFSFKQRAVQQIFSQAISEPFFSNLRTKQQTGYLVANRAEDIDRHLFTLFAIQSNSHDARDLLARFELLIEQFLQEMGHEGFGERNFETVRRSLLRQISQPPKSMEETMAWLRLIVSSYNADFDWMTKRQEAFEILTYEEFVQMTKEMFGKENRRRIAVLVRGKLPELKTLNYQKLQHPKDLLQYTKHKQLQNLVFYNAKAPDLAT